MGRVLRLRAYNPVLRNAERSTREDAAGSEVIEIMRYESAKTPKGNIGVSFGDEVEIPEELV